MQRSSWRSSSPIPSSDSAENPAALQMRAISAGSRPVSFAASGAAGARGGGNRSSR